MKCFFNRIKHIYAQKISENEHCFYKLKYNTFAFIIEETIQIRSMVNLLIHTKAGVFHFISAVKSETEEKLDEPYIRRINKYGSMSITQLYIGSTHINDKKNN
jgi:hypothetical protein